LRHTGFALADPFGVFFKDRKDLFTMRNLFVLCHPAQNLIDLALGMHDKMLDRYDLSYVDNGCLF
jgi:hypothetical protein